MPPAVCRPFATPESALFRFRLLPATIADGARRFGCGKQFFGNFFGFFRIEIQRQLNTTVSLDVDTHHSKIGWPDLNVRGDVALLVDTHRGPLETLTGHLAG